MLGKSETRSLASEDEIFTVDIDKAKNILAAQVRPMNSRGAAKPPLRDLGKDPNTGKNGHRGRPFRRVHHWTRTRPTVPSVHA